MTITIGRTAGLIEMDRSESGDTFSISGVTPVGIYNALLAMQQQLLGLINNQDELVVPFISTDDPSVNGLYRPVSMNLGYLGTQADGAFTFTAVLQQLLGFSNALCEITTQSVVRTNAHGFTVPPPIIAASAAVSGLNDGVDMRPSLLTASLNMYRVAVGGAQVACYLLQAPTALTQYRDAPTPDLFYGGACQVEILVGGAWYVMVGRDIPAATVWRISNGLIRLTSANAATSGTIEVWNGAAWESINVTHVTNGAVGPGIGLGNGASQPRVSILRNSPECVVVKCGVNPDMTYRIMRGANQVEASWTTGTATKYGAGFTATVATTAISTWGVRATANDANGNRTVFGMPVAITADNTNGRINAATATTSGTMFIGVEFNGSTAQSGDTAADLANQFFGLVNWSQRVISR